MRTIGLLMISAVLLSGCKTVSVVISEEGEPTRRVVVPFSLVKRAIYFSSEDTLVLEDLGGVSSSIDLGALAKAIHEDGDRVQIELHEGGTTMIARKKGQVFEVKIEDEDEESHITLNLPLTLMTALAKNESGRASTKELLRALKRYSGILVEIDGPYENVRIKLN